MPDTEGYWDIVVTSLQDTCNSNESLLFENVYEKHLDEDLDVSDDELKRLKEEISDHKSNVQTARRLVETSQQNLQTLISYLEKKASEERANADSKQAPSPSAGKRSSKSQSSKGGKINNKKNTRKSGRLFYTSKFNPLEPVVVGSEVAYKLRNRHFEEWIQCEVMKVLGDGIKFEIRDPEPDENNNPGQTFKANYKEILLIPPAEEVPDLMQYLYGIKVLARYPETTTFYPAIVVGERKDRMVRLKFDGEEEVNKETEVERRLVLPFPER